jgi:hypothetical protein
MKKGERKEVRGQKTEVWNWKGNTMDTVKIKSCDKNSLTAVKILPANTQANLPAKLQANLQAELHAKLPLAKNALKTWPTSQTSPT